MLLPSKTKAKIVSLERSRIRITEAYCSDYVGCALQIPDGANISQDHLLVDASAEETSSVMDKIGIECQFLKFQGCRGKNYAPLILTQGRVFRGHFVPSKEQSPEIAPGKKFVGNLYFHGPNKPNQLFPGDGKATENGFNNTCLIVDHHSIEGFGTFGELCDEKQ